MVITQDLHVEDSPLLSTHEHSIIDTHDILRPRCNQTKNTSIENRITLQALGFVPSFDLCFTPFEFFAPASSALISVTLRPEACEAA